MPLKRRGSAFIKSSKNRRAVYRKKKRAMIRRPPRGVSGFHVHNYKRYGERAIWQFDHNGSADYSAISTTFSLSQVTQYTELTNLYDQYKIMAVVVKVHLLNNPDSIYAPGVDGAVGPFKNPTFYPKLWYYRDYDDATAPADATVLKQIGKAKCFALRPNKVYSFKVKPAILNLLSGTATSPIWPKRLDCSNATQTHYGMKFALDYEGTPPVSGVSTKICIETLYYIKMFNSR